VRIYRGRSERRKPHTAALPGPLFLGDNAPGVRTVRSVTTDMSAMLIELVEVQTSSDGLRIGMSERAFELANDLRAIRKRWDESAPHAAGWTKELTVLSEAGQLTVAKAVTLAREINALRVERNIKLAASARELSQSLDRDPSSLLNEMIAEYRRELETDLPPLKAVMNDLEGQVAHIEALVESRLSSEGRSSKWIGRKRK